MACLTDSIPWRGDFEQKLVYAPEKRPGFVAWVTAFPYGDGSIGISFDETLEAENPDFIPPRLEFAEAAGVPVSYCSVEGGSARQRSYRVYMRSVDGVNFTETGRCGRREGSLCNAGFPDGRIVGFDVPRYNDERTGWSDCIRVRESRDGGSTWTDVRRLLEGTAPYLVARALSAGRYARGAGQPVRNALGPGQGARHTQHHAARRDLPEQDTAVFSHQQGWPRVQRAELHPARYRAPMNLILWNCPTDGFSSSRETCRALRWGASRHALSGRLAERHAVPHLHGRAPGTRCVTPRGGMCPRPLHGTHSGAASWVTGATNAFHSPTITVKIGRASSRTSRSISSTSPICWRWTAGGLACMAMWAATTLLARMT